MCMDWYGFNGAKAIKASLEETLIGIYLNNRSFFTFSSGYLVSQSITQMSPIWAALPDKDFWGDPGVFLSYVTCLHHWKNILPVFESKEDKGTYKKNINLLQGKISSFVRCYLILRILNVILFILFNFYNVFNFQLF